MADFVLFALQTVISICFVLVSIALVHELGHYIAAKLCKIWVLEFAIGFGNRIFKFKIGETLYSLRPILLGGFVRLAGMDNIEESDKETEQELDPDLPSVSANHPNSLTSKPFWAKSIVMAAGSVMNMVWATILFTIIYCFSGSPITNIRVLETIKTGPAYKAGIKSGDIISSINGNKITNWNDGIKIINRSAEVPIRLTVLRKKSNLTSENAAHESKNIAMNISQFETLELSLIPRGAKNNGQIGISLSPNNYAFQALPFAEAIKKSVVDCVGVITQTVEALFKMFTRQTEADMVGPVKIMEMIKDQSSKGIFDLLYLTAILSINIGLINLLPLPFLDGGRIVFVLLNALLTFISRFKNVKLSISTNFEETTHFFGMVALVCLMVFTTCKDIASFF